MTNDDILKLNDDFYQRVSEDFDKTRQTPWKGWDRVLTRIMIPEQTSFIVLDLACGNARFGQYLKKRYPQLCLEYTGFDNNTYLLNKAKDVMPSGKFTKIDLLRHMDCIEGAYDLTVIFGFMHHIPNLDDAISLLEKAARALNKPGYLCVTFWNYHLLKSNGEISGMSYIDEWAKNGAKRFVKTYSDQELLVIIDHMIQLKLTLIDDFLSDGRSSNLNRYLLFAKKL